MEIPLRDLRDEPDDGRGDVANVSMFRHEEPTKVIVTRSIQAALWPCTIHLVPIAVSATIIGLNINGTFLGADLMSPVRSQTINLMLFQLGAKAHEMAIVVSLGVIVVQCIRHELLFGQGLPLGLLGSGLAFNHVDFFFKKEFFGSLKYVGRGANRPRKVALILVVIVAGLVATLAGPASAVLLVPRMQDWDAGGTWFFLNGMESHFWPDDLSGNMSDLRQVCTRENSARLGVCPGAGYDSLQTHWGTMNSGSFGTETVPPYAKQLSGSGFYWPISSPSSLIPPRYALGDTRRESDGTTSLVQPHAATVAVLQQLAGDWWQALRAEKGLPDNQVDDRTASATFKNAITVARCAAPERLTPFDRAVQFPSIDGRFDFADTRRLEVNSLSPNSTDHLRFKWVHLPPKFGAASIGGLLEMPWEVTESEVASRVVIGCTIQAGWAPASVYTDKYTFWTGWYAWNIQFGDRTPPYKADSGGKSNGRVAFGDEWLQLLTPPAPLATSETSSWRPSTIESILLHAGLPTGTGLGSETNATFDKWLAKDNSTWQMVSLVESIVASVILDGLSQTGSYRVFNFSGPASGWSLADYNTVPNFDALIPNGAPAMRPTSNIPYKPVSIRARMKISGFSMQRSLATWLATSVLLTHMLMASAHSLYAVLVRHTSQSWNTVGELVALAQNSNPALDVLRNTSSGIGRSDTYAQIAQIQVVTVPDSPEWERVELAFNTQLDTDNRCHSAELRCGRSRLRNRRLGRSDTWPNHYPCPPISAHAIARGRGSSAERLVEITPIEDERGRTAARVQPGRRYA